jgi:hypothetical protein
VPETVFKPAMTAAGKTPVIPLIEKRSEKFMTEPPVAAEIILRKYALSTLAPRPDVMVPVTEFPCVKSPVVTSVVSWTCHELVPGGG